ncbi:MAG TPA: NADH-quinone oxidoreductase subunit NuoE [Armatimonadota bacterium]|nr:NADH-quinone oxidoreductase subunit NuoE [Armatimonadota bacterium]
MSETETHRQSGESVLSDAARAKIQELIGRFPQKRSALLPSLWVVQDENGWLSPEAMEEVADLLDLEPVQVEETASFYTMYFRQPVGKYVVDICTNIACMLNGGYELSRAVQAKLGIKPHETTGDGLFTLREVECIAACDKAPCAQINYEYYENLTPESLLRTLDSLAAEAAGQRKAGT